MSVRNDSEVMKKKEVPVKSPPPDKVLVYRDSECLTKESKSSDYKNNPIGLFQRWFQQAFQFGVPEPFIMSLATSSVDGVPSVRPVALCNVDTKGFYFSTNKNSQKAKDLKDNPKAGACFYWMKLDRVVRVEGDVEKFDDKGISFHQWPRDSQIAEHSKFQTGDPVDDRSELQKELDVLTAKFASMEVIPQPDSIQAFRISPKRIEFMQVHMAQPVERIVFKRSSVGESWSCTSLAR